MRLGSILLVGSVVLLAASPAFAYEKFIPLGTGYSTGVSSIPALNSDEQALTVQSDIYESEVYRKQLEMRRHQSYIDRFSNTNSDASDFSVDY